MSLKCRDRARHSKWGYIKDDGNVAWCEVCSPQNEPHGPPAPVPVEDEAEPTHEVYGSSTMTNEQAERVWGKRER